MAARFKNVLVIILISVSLLAFEFSWQYQTTLDTKLIHKYNKINESKPLAPSIIKYNPKHCDSFCILLDKIPKHIFITQPSNINDKHITYVNHSLHCKHINPEWTIHNYNDSMLLNSLDNLYKSQNKVFKKSKFMVESADIWRYNIINKHGGLYMDFDVQCLKPTHKWMQLYEYNATHLPYNHKSKYQNPLLKFKIDYN
eukprot:121702_1